MYDEMRNDAPNVRVLSDQTVRAARRDHRCDGCGAARGIRAGEFYGRMAFVEEGRFGTEKTCARARFREGPCPRLAEEDATEHARLQQWLAQRAAEHAECERQARQEAADWAEYERLIAQEMASGPQPVTEPTKQCMRPDGCDDEWRCTSQEVGACGTKTTRPQPVAQKDKED